MIPNSDQYNIPYKIAVGTVTLLTVFSIVFYKERMFFIDPCWVAFNIINTKTFSIPEYRYGSFITQIYPLAGVYLGLSVKTILILYSASFYIFYLGTVLIAGFVWKQKWLGILLAIYLTLFVSDVYFWPNNEVHQGIAWMVLFLSYYNYRENKRNNLIGNIVLFVFCFMAISSHLLVAPPLLFLWLYTNMERHKKISNFLRDKRSLIFTFIIITLITIRYKLSTDGWYDGVKLEGVKSISLNSIISSFSSLQSKSFLELTLTNYWIAIPIFLLSVIYLIKSKRYIQLLLSFLFAIAYFSLICITYPNSIDRQILFYMESEWMALSLIIATPFVAGSQFILKRKFIVAVIFLAFFGIRLGYIANAYTYFNKRFSHLDKNVTTFHKQGENKTLIVMEKEESESLYIMDWGLPVESLMLAATKGYSSFTTFKVIPSTYKVSNVKDSFYSCFTIEPTSILNKDYFELDSTKSYKLINK